MKQCSGPYTTSSNDTPGFVSDNAEEEARSRAHVRVAYETGCNVTCGILLQRARRALLPAIADGGSRAHVEYRYGRDDIERVPALASELVKLPVSLVVAQGAAVPTVASMRLPVPVV